MVINYIKPSGILSEFVQYYWVLEIDAAEGEVKERVVPIGNIQMMFHYKKPFICKSAKEDSVQPQSFISGLSCEWADAIACGDSGVIAVVFHPFGACNFMEFPLHQIENATINLYAIEGYGARFIEEQINGAPSLVKRVEAVENYLLSRFRPVDRSTLGLMKNIVNLVLGWKGRITAAELSKNLYLSPKSLERRCSALIGISPKQFIRITRFQEVIRGLSQRGEKLLTEISCDHGYFDQAHFIKDFKALCGYTPREFLCRYPCRSEHMQGV